MGQASHVAIADSPTQPGAKSAVSIPLDDRITRIDRFFADFVEDLRDPRPSAFDKTLEWRTKSFESIDHGEEEYSVRVVYDGEKNQKLGVGVGRDFVWKSVVRHSLQRREITQEIWILRECTQGMPLHDETNNVEQKLDAEGMFLSNRTVTRFLEDPLRVEAYQERSGERIADDIVAFILGARIRSGIVVENARVKVLYDVDSLDGSGPSVVSEELDEYLTYERLFTMVVGMIRDLPRLAWWAGVDAQLQDVSESEFNIISQQVIPPEHRGGTSESYTVRTQVRHVEETGQVFMVVEANGNLLMTDFIRIHQEPLILECWSCAADGTRLADRWRGMLWLQMIERFIDQAANEWVW